MDVEPSPDSVFLPDSCIVPSDLDWAGYLAPAWSNGYER
jgi:hypothetical protein